jgi:deoxyadenosine/deoxycytidine kinase
VARTRFVAVAGNIGAGKSSLVKWLHQTFGLRPFFEPQDENPYLADFYRDMRRWAYSSQLFFLVQRFRMHREMERQFLGARASGTGTRTPPAAPFSGLSELRGVVQDRTIFEDAEVFAAHHHQAGNIDDRDWRTYSDLYRTLRDELAPPDLMIYLRCPMPALKKRIKLRGRAYESSIPTAYLRALDRLYEDWFARYDLSPTLILDTSELDYVTKLFDRHALIGEIERRIA